MNNRTPESAWQPWEPSAGDPWNRKWAGHLYRRAGFGASREELLEAEKLGHGGTLDLLLRGRSDAVDLLPTILDVGRVAANREDSGEKLRDWWLYAMLHGRHPLREKLTLFWHNHFATSIAKVRGAEPMFRQNCTLREHALGKFGPFLQAVSRDPAMLLWLDSNSNVKGKPNENYAREVMELFSLGVGNYTEKDIREAARAFTGWHTDGKAFRFKAAFHDAGSKTFFGKTGNWDGGDIVAIVLQQPVAARFLVRKLYTHFVSETPPDDSLIEPLCESFRNSDYNIAALMKTMLSSRLFFSDAAFRKRIKSPVEFALGAVRAVYHEFDEKDVNYRPLPHALLTPRINAMSQALFAPPNVKGWPGGKAWLNTQTMLERNNFAAAIASGTLWYSKDDAFQLADGVPPPAAFDSARIVDKSPLASSEIVRVLLEIHLPGGIRRESQEKLTAFLAAGKPSGLERHRRIRETVHAILTLPEYQLC
jgi:uncharacterized protein (DUF1800 family)